MTTDNDKKNSNQKVMNRWLVVVGAILIQLALGAIYAWSAFTAALKKAPYEFSTPQTQAIFSAALFTFALVMIFAGIWMKKTGPRKMAITGGLVLGSAYILAGFFGNSFISQLIFIGIIGGTGIGLTYVVPLAVSMKWFPKKKGLISGIAVAGFGFGATIWVKVGGSWFDLINKLGVQTVFLYYGIAFMAMILIGSIWMVNPPEKLSKKIESTEAKKKIKPSTDDLGWRQMLSKYGFWAIWFIFIVGGGAGLMVIGTIKLFGIDTLQNSGLTAVAAGAAAGSAMAWYAIFNGLGRIVWGKISDNLGPRKTIFIMTLLQGILMLTLFKFGTTPLLLTLYASAIGFNFGGNFSLFPVVTAKLFGTKNVGSNYPFVFTAYGIAGIAGPMLGGFVRDTTGNFQMAFFPAGIACIIGAIVALTVKTKKN